MDTDESKGPIDYDFFNEDSEKDAQLTENRPKNGIKHLSQETLREHDKVSGNTRPSKSIDTNDRLVKHGTSIGSDDDHEDIDKNDSDTGETESNSAGERSSRSTNISVKVPSALDNISDSESDDGDSSVASRASDCDRENNNGNVGLRFDNDNRHKVQGLTRSQNPEPTETISSSNTRPRTAKVGTSGRNKHHASWTSEDVSDRNGSDHSSRSYSSSETESKSTFSDSDSSVTDVSPLHSPERSKKYEGLSVDGSFEKRQRPKKDRSRKADGVRFVEVTPGYTIHGKSRSQNQDSETRELSMLLRAVLEMDDYPSRTDLESFQRKMNRPSSGKPRGGNRPQSAQLPHQRMNMSFSNDEVQRIDRENQRLLGKIMTNKPQVSLTQNSRLSGQQLSHAAIRRKREQRKIELDNMQILKRIQEAKASPTVRKDTLTKHYQKQVQYSSQVGKSPHRPSSARRTGSTYANKMAKASSMSSLNSDFSKMSSTGSRPSSGKQSILSDSRPPSQSRPVWDEHWQVG